ncbi:MAG: hypothetical protein ACPGUD_06955 [Parashewanella sp.]
MNQAKATTVNDMANANTKTRRSFYNGMWRLWMGDIGSASFLIIGFLFIFGFTVFTLLAEPAQVSDVANLYSIGQFTVYSGIAYQILRLQATEWAGLVAGFRQHVYQQSAFIYLLALLPAFISSLYFGHWLLLNAVLLTSFFGCMFIAACISYSKCFYACSFIFTTVFVIPDLAELLPLAVTVGLNLLITMIICLQLTKLNWKANAHYVFSSGQQTGWIWLPKLPSNALTKAIERRIYPANLFMGPLLAQSLILIPLLLIFGDFLLYQLTGVNESNNDIAADLILIMSQAYGISFLLLNWTRIQRNKAVETISLLPVHNSTKELVNAFINSQRLILGFAAVSVMIFCMLTNLWHDNMTLLTSLHLMLSIYCTGKICFGLGNLCRTILQISVAMFLALVLFAWVSVGLLLLEDNEVTTWLWISVIFFVVGEVLLRASKRKLWRGDLV